MESWGCHSAFSPGRLRFSFHYMTRWYHQEGHLANSALVFQKKSHLTHIHMCTIEQDGAWHKRSLLVCCVNYILVVFRYFVWCSKCLAACKVAKMAIWCPEQDPNSNNELWDACVNPPVFWVSSVKEFCSRIVLCSCVLALNLVCWLLGQFIQLGWSDAEEQRWTAE